MNKENVKKWVAALRSGEFEQCKHRLADGKGAYCCLGVVEVLRGVKRVSTRDEGVLSTRGMKWLGVTSDNPAIGDNDAAVWNDSIELSFRDIADLIEKEWLLPLESAK